MADEKPWSVAFAGTGDTSEANIKELLDDWLPGKLEHLTVPERIGRRHTGLKRVRAWLEDEVGAESLSEAAVSISGDGIDLGAGLGVDRAEGCEVYLVYIPAEEWDEESDEAKLVRACIAEQIPVKDLTAGLDDFVPPEPTAPEGENKPTRQRGKPRDPSPETVEAAVEDAKAFVQEAVKGLVEPLQEPQGAPPADGVAVTLSQDTIAALVAFAGLLATDVRASVVADLPESAKPKAVTYPYWMDQDGNYRPRVGRGRPKAGEEKVDLTPGEIEQLGLTLPE